MRKILIACDDSVLAMLYSMELMEEGYDAVVSPDWNPTLESLQNERPDLVLVYWSRARYEDSDFCRTAQSDPYQIPVIHCLDSPPTKKDLEFLCVNYFVLKSSNLEKLKNTIKRICEGGSLAQAPERPPAVVETGPIPSTQIPFNWE
jgi:DNA-binding response OmpR family regulator